MYPDFRVCWCVCVLVSSISSVDSIRVEGARLRKSRSSWTPLRPHLQSVVFTPYEQCRFSKLPLVNDNCKELIADDKRMQALEAARCSAGNTGKQGRMAARVQVQALDAFTKNGAVMPPSCTSPSHLEEQLLRWDGAQDGPDSNPSTFLDVLQRLPSGINTILVMGDSTMGHLYGEAVCSLVRHLPEDLLGNMTYTEGGYGSLQQDVEIFSASGKPPGATRALRIPLLGRDVMVMYRRHQVVDEDEAITIRSMFETIWRLRGGVLTVASQGFHGFSNFESTLPTILNALQFSGQRAKSRTFFLEPQATHFPNAGGLYAADADVYYKLHPELRDRIFPVGPSGCRSDVSADNINYYGSILNKVFATRQFPNVTLLPFWKETSKRGAAHIGQVDSKLDCLHVCHNALLYEPIWEAMRQGI